MKVVWINGWGLGSSYLEKLACLVYPQNEHEIIVPCENWNQKLEEQPRSATVLAYSLGAFLLLSRPDLMARFNRVVLLAPFEDFKLESERGGTVRKGQLVYLRRWLQNDKDAAVGDFRARAGLNVSSIDSEELSVSDLVWGIDRLINDSIELGSLENREVWIGSDDTLLDAQKMEILYPNINIVPEKGHDLGDLLRGAEIKL